MKGVVYQDVFGGGVDLVFLGWKIKKCNVDI